MATVGLIEFMLSSKLLKMYSTTSILQIKHSLSAQFQIYTDVSVMY